MGARLIVGRMAVAFALLLPGAVPVMAFSHEDYAETLKTHVNDKGMVSYAQLKADGGKRGAFVAALGNLDAKTYEGWSEKDRIAFWINAYNALTLKAIIDHYPIKAGGLSAWTYPKNSIRQIDGVWDKLKFNVMGREMTLDEIEDQTLRTKFNEPRIHMALVCAAMGCPPLRNEPYTGKSLDAQLDDQARKFLGNSAKFRIDRDRKRVFLSPIFKWFGKDFVAKYGVKRGYGDHSDAERAVLNFISGYLSADDARYLKSGAFKIKYLDYDWSLNAQ